MDESEVQLKVRETIADITFNDLDEVIPDKPVANWDSAAQVMIIATLEDLYDVEFSPEEISELNTIEKLTESVMDKLGS